MLILNVALNFTLYVIQKITSVIVQIVPYW
jgi:hypothetical protein